eukprot:CAMPEP_0173461686 /NCGR_PEP_ID=MMETSP1357-20121228/65363_1 /TAXON_ID=77926 /ORGANISM="Hemiselmis rufescens, Strain PCC563" /LENGTH=58 /DNA_ID=CAMNT_0014429355 /DNA_START=61 /DNA_END=234 /DNA_ORIENTATION=-
MIKASSNGCSDMILANYMVLCPWLFTSDNHYLKQKEAVSMIATLHMLSSHVYETYKRR